MGATRHSRSGRCVQGSRLASFHPGPRQAAHAGWAQGTSDTAEHDDDRALCIPRCYAASADGARLLRDETAPLTESDLLNLPRYRMAVRTELGGETRVLTADVLPESPSLGSASLVQRLSNARDAKATVT